MKLNGAVFLSYASQDAEAAQLIALALRGEGVEVWFDRNELRGGDAWDAKIRRQIRECALFIPVISARTQLRPEGYFRLEWKLAVDRSHLMADDAPFLLPVVIDETTQSDARVPERFLERQWCHVANGKADGEFVRQVRRLLTSDGLVSPRRSTSPPISQKKSRPIFMSGLIFMSAIIIFFLGRVLLSHFSAAGQADLQAPERSIAVLPFANISEDSGNAFFADGVHEDILTSLALVAGLQVISRTSVMGYRDTKKTIRQIGEELNVRYILEGTVRRIGASVRVSGELINAQTDRQLWAKSYDRSLNDIFEVQTNLAKEIVKALQMELTPVEIARLEEQPTTNIGAYDLYLKALEILHSETPLPDAVSRAQSLLESAVELDPKFALAWAELVFVHLRFFHYLDHTEGRLTKAKRALDQVLLLAPNSFEALTASLSYQDAGEEGKGVPDILNRLEREFPNHPDTASILADFRRNSDENWRERLAADLRARSRDPRNPMLLQRIADLYLGMRHYDEASDFIAQANAIQPPSIRRDFHLAVIPFWAKGSAHEGDTLLSPWRNKVREADPETIAVLSNWAAGQGNAAEIIRLWQESGQNWRFAFLTGRFDTIVVAMAYHALGQPEKAKPLLEKYLSQLSAQLAEEPQNGLKWGALALVHAMLGHDGEAEIARQKARRLVPWDNAVRMSLAWGGKKAEAIAEIEEAMKHPPYSPIDTNVFELRRNLFFWPLQREPRFLALLNDPHNNTPVP